MKNLENNQEEELIEITYSTPKTDNKFRSKKWFSKKSCLTIAMNFIVLVIMMFCLIKIRPTIKIGFICKDPKLSFPFPDETIKNWVVFAGNTIGPTIIIFLVELYVERKFNENWYKHSKKWCIEYFVGLLLNIIFLNVTKTAYPELRPHFFDSCRPDTGITCVSGEYVREYQCTNKDLPYSSIADSHRSFFSGHASISVYGSIFCAWFVHRRFSSPTLNTMIQPLIMILIILYCVICSTTRITDHRHHWWDVLFGIIFGVIIALYVIIGRCKNFKMLSNN